MAVLRELEVDIMVLAGHRHGPNAWSISGVRVVYSGPTSGWRGRRTMHPYYNVIEFDSQEIKITLREPGNGQGEPLAFFSRNPVITSKFFRDFDRLVKYDGIPLPKR